MGEELSTNKIAANFACAILSSIIFKDTTPMNKYITSIAFAETNSELLLIYKNFIDDNPLIVGDDCTNYELLAKSVYNLSMTMNDDISVLKTIYLLIGKYIENYPDDINLKAALQNLVIFQLLGCFYN